MNRSNLPWFLFIGAVIVIILLILFQPKKAPSPYIEQTEQIIAQKSEKIEVLTKEYVKIAEKMKSDSLEAAKSDSVYETRVKTLRSTVAKLRANPKVVTIIQENPEIDSLVTAYDSAFMQMSAQIFSLQTTLRQVYTNEALLEHNFNERLELERSKFEDQKAITEQYEKDLRKSKRGSRLLKAGAVVLGVGAFVLGSSL
jgi:hypothetical protein